MFKKGITYYLTGQRIHYLVFLISITVVILLTPIFIPHKLTNQLFMGTLVNILLFISFVRFGLVNSIIIALLFPLTTLLYNNIPKMLEPALYFILLSNLVFIFSLSITKGMIRVFRITLPILLKLIFLLSCSYIFGDWLLLIDKPVVNMIRLPMIYNSLSSLIILFFIIKIVKNEYSNPKGI